MTNSAALTSYISSTASMVLVGKLLTATGLSWTNTHLGVAIISRLLTTISSFAVSSSRVSLAYLSRLDITLKHDYNVY